MRWLPTFLLLLTCAIGHTASPVMTLLSGDPEPGQHRLIWSTDPGIRYELQETSNINDPDSWTTVAGYPTEAEALAQQALIELDAPDRKFYRVVMLDEQPPEIVSKSPADGAFGIGRYMTTITIGLDDLSGVDPPSIHFTVADHGTFTLEDSELNFDDGMLTFWLGGDTPLGGWGETIIVELVASDTVGNTATYTWSFQLEQEPIYAESLFIFGSPDAQRLGQEIGPIPTRAVAQRWAGQSGPIRMNADAAPWRLVSVEADRLVIEYDAQSPAPHFAEGQYLCNITPETLDEIFYRQVTEVIDDATSTLTLMTVDVGLEEIALQETFRLDENAMAFEVDDFGVITRAVALRSSEDGRIELDPIGIDWSGQAVFGTYAGSGGSLEYRFGLPIPSSPPGGGSWNSRLVLDQAHLTVTPILDFVLETGGFLGLRLDRFTADFELEVDSALVPRYEFEIVSELMNQRDTLWETHKVIIIKIGWIHVNPKLDLSTGMSAGLTGSISAGVTGGFSPYAIIDYVHNRDEAVQYDYGIRNRHFSVIEPSLLVHGSLSAYAKLIPEIDLKLISLVGCYINIDPGVTLTGLASIEDASLTSAALSVRLDAHLNAGMSLLFAGGADWLPALDPVPLLNPPWEYRWTYPDEEVLHFVQQPRNTTVREGQHFSLTAEAHGPGAISYQWYQNGLPIDWGSTFTRSGARLGHAGEYQVVARSDGQAVWSDLAAVSVMEKDYQPEPPPVVNQAGNLLSNAGFEFQGSQQERAEHWEKGMPDPNGGYWGTAARVDWRSRSGSWAGAIRGLWAGASYGQFWQRAPAVPGQEYELSAWFWADYFWDPHFEFFDIEFFDQNFHLIHVQRADMRSIKENWTRRSVVGHAPPNAAWVQAVVGAAGSLEGALMIDDVMLHALHRLNNSSFEVAGSQSERARYWESGVPDANGDSWGTARRVDWRAHSGEWAGAIAGQWAGGSEGGFRQRVPVTQDQAIQLSGWFWADQGTFSGEPWYASSQSFVLEFLDANKELVHSHMLSLDGVGERWSQKRLYGVAPQGAVWAQAVVRVTGAGPSGALMVDDVEFQTLSCLGSCFNEAVWIPAGTNSGVDPDFGPYSLTVDWFAMDRYLVTVALWDKVYFWALNNGYSFDNSGSGKAANHPVHSVNWHDVVKWCNARSEKEGRPPVYRVGNQVYRSGRSDDVVQTSAAGYRLPTAVEWEYAARGGLSDMRFPWGDSINHSHANYEANGSLWPYDTSHYTSPTFHPSFNDDVMPLTSPVGLFAANGYGLYDMAGNVWEWVFDWQPSMYGVRMIRGGGWHVSASSCRVGYSTASYDPANTDFGIGFRAVLPLGQ